MMATAAANTVERVYRNEWGRIVATLIRLLSDFDLAEECAQEAFTAAVDQWEETGVPENPRAWIIQTARNKAIDRIRRQMRYTEKLALMGNAVVGTEAQQPIYDATEIPDDQLRLIFTCCHPAHVVRPRDRRDCAGVSDFDDDDGAAAGAREAEDSRCEDSVRGAGNEGHGGAAGSGADGDLPRI